MMSESLVNPVPTRSGSLVRNARNVRIDRVVASSAFVWRFVGTHGVKPMLDWWGGEIGPSDD
jgi:hypothetical protein